jgi:hypothetical protein
MRQDRWEQIRAAVTVNESGCWVPHLAAAHPRGYRSITVREGARRRVVLVHRLAYEMAVGDPTGLEVHHRCGHAACCNPAHLQALTTAEHAAAHRPSTCVRGHSLEEHGYTDRHGWRTCKVCRAAAMRRLRQRRRLAAAA